MCKEWAENRDSMWIIDSYLTLSLQILFKEDKIIIVKDERMNNMGKYSGIQSEET